MARMGGMGTSRQPVDGCSEGAYDAMYVTWRRLAFLVLWIGAGSSGLAAESTVYPGATWETCSPEEAGLSRQKLTALSELVGGRGCVVREGRMVFSWGDASKSRDVASAFKPLLSTLLFMAIQEGRLHGVDDKVPEFEPRLNELNGGKDAGITWRHFTFQTSGYGLVEAPGAAYSYNDYALALYYDTLTDKVFGTNGTEVLRTRLAEPLQFEDRFTFDAFGPGQRAGRLALSVRDFARFGLLYLRGGQWRERQLLKPEFAQMAISSPLAPETPLTSGRTAEMLPGQRSVGGSRNITPVGPGYYSFNWWLNRTNREGQRLFVAAPDDAYVASGHGGMRMLWIMPSLDLIVCWNDSKIEDHDQSPGNPNTKCNQAARLMREAVLKPGEDRQRAATTVGIEGTRFTLNGRPTFLLGLSYFGALGASEAMWQKDLADTKRYGFNWIRVWATWSSFGEDVSAVDAEGKPREPFLSRLRQLVAECDQRGMAVDITLSRGITGPGGPLLQTMAAHRRAVETLVTALKPYRNWYLDLSNERNVRDKRFTGFEDLKELRAVARRLDPARLVTASHGGDISREELRRYLEEARVDFVAPHRPRGAQSPAGTQDKTKEYFRWMKECGRETPVHYQEPFRRGYDKWQPRAADYIADCLNARRSGAAGWCFHNGAERGKSERAPRRSFDLRERRLFEQLDEEERKAVEGLSRDNSMKPRTPTNREQVDTNEH